MVEQLICNQQVAGSSPFTSFFRGVAQPGSASGLGPEGRRFKSCLPDKQNEQQQRSIVVKNNKNLSNLCFVASLASVAVSIVTWVSVGDTDPAHAERFGIFIGLWAPTLMGLANYYKE